MPRRWTALFAIAASVVAAQPASAASWSGPIQVSSPRGTASEPQLDFNARGTAYVAWATYPVIDPNCVGHCESAHSAYTATRAPGRAFSAPSPVGDPYGMVPVQAGAGLLFGALEEIDGAVGIDALFGGRKALDRGATGQLVATANRRGGAVAAWTSIQGYAHRPGVWASLRKPRGKAGSKVHLSSFARDAEQPAVAINERGDVAVAWLEDDGARIKMRYARNGKKFGAIRTVGTTPAPAAERLRSVELAVAIDDRSRVTVLWGWTDSYLVGNALAADGALQMAQSRAGTRFGPATGLTTHAVGGLRAAPGGKGEVLAAWGSSRSPVPRAQVARITARGAQLTPIEGVAPGSLAASIDSLPDGRAAVAFAPDSATEAGRATPTVQIALRDIRGGWSPGETIPGAPSPQTAAGVALDPRTGGTGVLFKAGGRTEPQSLWFAQTR